MAKKRKTTRPAPRKGSVKRKAVRRSTAKTGSTASSETVVKPSATGAPFPIVGIGASAGGLEAMIGLLQNMPTDTGMAFVVVTHQHPGHTSLLPELLGKATKIPVAEAADGVKIEPNHIYIGPSGGHLAILGGTLHRMETDREEAPKLPIDYFFRSLADDQKEKSICIILSGTGTDGTLGLKAIKGESGMAMVEEPQSAKYAGMPSSAIATGLADYVLPPADMPKQLLAYANGPYLTGTPALADEEAFSRAPLQKIFLQLRSRTGHDFSGYKINTLRRRVERRMNVHQINSPRQYVRFLQENPHEVDILFKELLISVTNFFRDADAWEALTAGALPGLVQSRPDGYTLRVWVPGCSTGEEVFSMAIALRECMDKTNRRLDIQIFGTDLDAHAIEIARGGQYPDGIAVDVSPQRLQRHFVRTDSAYRVRNELREMAIFAPQNAIKDPPFTKLDMISCRNLLIYLNAEVQKKLLPVFHYALKPGGILFLGPSETIGSLTDLFEPVEKRWKIFVRKECPSALQTLPTMPVQPAKDLDNAPAAAPSTPRTVQTSTLIERLLLGRFAPATVVVNDRGDILYIHGRTGYYLEPSQGQPRNNIFEMAREGLRMELTSALRQASTHDREVHRENVRVKTNSEYSDVNLSVVKIQEPEAVRGLLLVTFRPTPVFPARPAAKKGRRKRADDSSRVEQLERELHYTKESLQMTVEELETSNEELKSANEELQSTNEELQSTNEELETSKEELQSLNEELTTVNTELQSKLDELSAANNDMQNLLNSTEIATVFLDNLLNIKRYTERATNLINLIPTDIGRPIGDLVLRLKHDSLIDDCLEVLRTLVFKEVEVETTHGAWYLMRMMPYRTAENFVDGLVLTFVNIDRLKRAESEAQWRAYYFESVFDTVRQPLLVLDDNHRVEKANRYFHEEFRFRPQDVEKRSIWDLGNGEWNIAPLRELLEAILPKNATLDDFRVEHAFANLGRRVYLLNARRLRREPGLPAMILLAMEDVTGDRPPKTEKPNTS